MFAEVGPKIQSQPLNNLNFKEALEKRTELQLLFPEFNIVLQQIHTGYILEIQVSTPAEREKVLKHPHYKKFAPFITLEAVGVKDTAKKTTK